MGRLYWRDVALASGRFLTITYVFCVGYDLLLGQRMYEAWLKLIPGFTWLDLRSFLRGLVTSFGYGIYVGLVFTPLYNFFHSRSAERAARPTRRTHGHASR